MVELLLCKQVVVGSSPVGSTISLPAVRRPARRLWQAQENGEAGPSALRTGIPPSPAKRETQFSFRGGDHWPPPEKSFFRQEAKHRAPARGARAARRAGLAPILAPRLYGRAADALAAAGDEGRGKLRKAPGRRMRPSIRGFPNGATRPPRGGRPRQNPYGGGRETRRSETSQ